MMAIHDVSPHEGELFGAWLVRMKDYARSNACIATGHYADEMYRCRPDWSVEKIVQDARERREEVMT